MPPKASKQVEAVTSEQMEEVLARLCSIQERLDSVEKLLAATQAENTELKSANTELHNVILENAATIKQLRLKQNSLEQYNRSWSVRIAGVHLPAEESNDPIKVMSHVYQQALLPILRGAVDKGLLNDIPPVHQLLETAHILPARDSGKPKPIIARFYSRNMRAMVFQLKKEFGVKTSGSSTSLKFPIYEDLTKTTFQLLRALADDQRTGAVWSVGGVIKYKLAGSSEVKKVACVLDTVDDILK